MKMKSKILSIGFILILTVSCVFGQFDKKIALYEALITAVIDGDTIQVQFSEAEIPPGCSRSERVRLIGVDTPELFTTPPEYYAEAARDFINQFYRTSVLLEFDSISAPRDKYGRLLAYVYNDISSMPLNKQLIAGGYGYYYGVFSFDSERMVEFLNAEDYARIKRRGIWE